MQKKLKKTWWVEFFLFKNIASEKNPCGHDVGEWRKCGCKGSLMQISFFSLEMGYSEIHVPHWNSHVGGIIHIQKTYIWAAVKINCLRLVQKYSLSLFFGALSLYSVLFKSTLKHAKMQRNWLHGFRSLNCRGWIKGRSLPLRLQRCWGTIWSYLSTFLGSFLSKEICYNFNSELERQDFIKINGSLLCWALLLVGTKWVYPSSGVPFPTHKRLSLGYR